LFRTTGFIVVPVNILKANAGPQIKASKAKVCVPIIIIIDFCKKTLFFNFE
jgi:hypothetical protein